MNFAIEVLSVAFPLFLLMDPIGNVPLFVTLLKDFEGKKQRRIIVRELLIALCIIVLFNFIGNFLLSILNVELHTILISGGLILFLIAIRMIFPSSQELEKHSIPSKKEPFIVPLAIPLVAGPAVLAAVMLYSKQESSPLITVLGILLAWIASTIILLSSGILKKILGEKGLLACEKLMGLILTLIAVQMFLSGMSAYLHQVHLTTPPLP